MAKRKTKARELERSPESIERRKRLRSFTMGDPRALVDARALKRTEPPARRRAVPPNADAPTPKRRTGKRSRARKDA